MTTRYKTKAFVFKKEDRNECDRVFSVFTSDFGRLEIYAKAIRKGASKLRNGIDIFFLSEIEFIQGKNKKTLTDATKINKFDGILQSAEKFSSAMVIAKVLDDFLRGQEKDENIYSLLQEIFLKLNESDFKKEKCALLQDYFLWNILSLMGYKPEIYKCSACRKELAPQGVYFSCKEGGVVCKKCSELDKNAKEINADVVKVLRLIIKKDWQTLNKLKIEPASQKILLDVSSLAGSAVASGI